MDGYTKVNADGDATHKELETTMNKQNVHNDILPSEKESNFSINFNANDKNKLDASNLRQPEVEGLVPNQEVEVSPQKPEQIQEMRAYDRSEKLLSSRANQRSAVWLSFFFIAGLYTLYFVLSFVGQTSFLGNVRMGLDHLRLIAQGIPQVRYVNVFTQEEIGENDIERVYKYDYSSSIDNIFAKPL